MAMNDLAMRYWDHGGSRKQLPFKRRLVPKTRHIDGPDHPNTLKTMESLALTNEAHGRPEEALILQLEASRDDKEVATG